MNCGYKLPKDTKGGKEKLSDIKHSKCHLVSQKFHVHWPENETDTP